MKNWFSIITEDQNIENMEKQINAPYVSINNSTDSRRPKSDTISIIVGLDKKENWTDSHYQNSRYGHFYYSSDGTLEQVARRFTLTKFRKTKTSSFSEAVKKIEGWLKENI